MNLYRLLPITGVRFLGDGYVTDIPFNPQNTSYQAFKQQINDDKAQLEDTDSNLMTDEQAKAYVATLP